jgi:hypothetical protein
MIPTPLGRAAPVRRGNAALPNMPRRFRPSSESARISAMHRSSTRHQSEPFEKGKQGIARAIPFGRVARQRRMCERALLESDVGVQIGVSSFGRFVTEPERDHPQDNTTLLQRHGGCVSTRLRASRSCR